MLSSELPVVETVEKLALAVESNRLQLVHEFDADGIGFYRRVATSSIRSYARLRRAFREKTVQVFPGDGLLERLKLGGAVTCGMTAYNAQRLVDKGGKMCGDCYGLNCADDDDDDDDDKSVAVAAAVLVLVAMAVAVVVAAEVVAVAAAVVVATEVARS